MTHTLRNLLNFVWLLLKVSRVRRLLLLGDSPLYNLFIYKLLIIIYCNEEDIPEFEESEN
jgi:hypothetical protein